MDEVIDGLMKALGPEHLWLVVLLLIGYLIFKSDVVKLFFGDRKTSREMLAEQNAAVFKNITDQLADVRREQAAERERGERLQNELEEALRREQAETSKWRHFAINCVQRVYAMEAKLRAAGVEIAPFDWDDMLRRSGLSEEVIARVLNPTPVRGEAT